MALGAMFGSISCAAKIPSMSALTLMRPSPSVTGIIRTKTRLTAGSRQSKTNWIRPPRPRSQGTGRTSWTNVAARIAPA